MSREFLKMVNDADEKTLMMSLRDCHANAVDSIVVKNNNGILTRAFIAWGPHKLWMNKPEIKDYTVGIHDHKYPLSLRLLKGSVRNMVYEETYCGDRFSEFEFKSIITNKELVDVYELVRRDVHLGIKKAEDLKHDKWLHMTSNELHTIWASPGPAAWLVQEGMREKRTSRLFQTEKTLDFKDLYQPFSSREEIIQVVESFFS